MGWEIAEEITKSTSDGALQPGHVEVGFIVGSTDGPVLRVGDAGRHARSVHPGSASSSARGRRNCGFQIRTRRSAMQFDIWKKVLRYAECLASSFRCKTGRRWRKLQDPKFEACGRWLLNRSCKRSVTSGCLPHEVFSYLEINMSYAVFVDRCK